MVTEGISKAQIYFCHMLWETGITMCWVVWKGFLEKAHKGQADPRWREGTARRRNSVSKGRRRQSTQRAKRAAGQAGVSLGDGYGYLVGTMI